MSKDDAHLSLLYVQESVAYHHLLQHFYAPGPNEIYESYLRPIIEHTQKAISGHDWLSRPTIVMRDSKGIFMGITGLDAVHIHQAVLRLGSNYLSAPAEKESQQQPAHF